MDAFNGFNNNIGAGVFSILQDAEMTGATLFFYVMRRVGLYSFFLAIMVTGIVMFWPKKGKEVQEWKQRVLRVTLALILFFGFFWLFGLIGGFLEAAIAVENTQIN